MKKRTRVMLLFALVLSLALLSGCGKLTEKLTAADPESNRLLEAFMDALIADDAPQAYALMLDNEAVQDSFAQAFPLMHGYWDGSPAYTYVRQSIQTNITNGDQTVRNTYIVTSGAGKQYIVTLTRVALSDGRQGISQFNITRAEEYAAATTPTGTIATIGQWNLAQYLLLAWSIACFALSVAATVHCVRHAKQGRWLWILLSMLLYAGVQYTHNAGGGIQVALRIVTIQTSKLLLYPDGSLSLWVFLPLGALFYFAFRKTIGTPKPPKNAAAAPPAPSTMQTAADVPAEPAAQEAADAPVPPIDDVGADTGNAPAPPDP